MARLPIRQFEIIALACRMIAGFSANPGVFPSPPVPPAQLQALFDPFPSDADAATAADAVAAAARIKKNGARQRPRDAMTKGLRRAEVTAPSPGDRSLSGWGPHKPAGTLEPPGPSRALAAIRRGADRVFLDGKEPVDGGKAAAFHVAPRELADGPRQPAGASVISEAMPGNQPAGKHAEYRAIAENKAGTGPAGNTVEVAFEGRGVLGVARAGRARAFGRRQRSGVKFMRFRRPGG
jgi:hypothetical protein